MTHLQQGDIVVNTRSGKRGKIGKVNPESGTTLVIYQREAGFGAPSAPSCLMALHNLQLVSRPDVVKVHALEHSDTSVTILNIAMFAFGLICFAVVAVNAA